MVRGQWTIAPLIVGTAVRDRSQWVLLAPIGVTSESAVLAWLLMNDDERILVDTGLGPLDTPEMQNLFGRTSEQTLQHQLSRFGTQPKEIKVVINTHLHTDHCGGNTYVRNAKFLVQRNEMEYSNDPLPVQRPAYDVNLEGVDFEFLDGDTVVAPGIRVILTPGHSPGSQAVLVETARGPYVIAGDTITHFEHMAVPDGDPYLATSFYTDLREYYQSLYLLKSLNAFILPSHDMLVLRQQTYP
jgi:N-acyl homoserine lactone hydrolase